MNSPISITRFVMCQYTKHIFGLMPLYFAILLLNLKALQAKRIVVKRLIANYVMVKKVGFISKNTASHDRENSKMATDKSIIMNLLRVFYTTTFCSMMPSSSSSCFITKLDLSPVLWNSS